MEESCNLIPAIVAAGMGVSFFVADRRSPTSRALALALCLLGLTTVLSIPNHAGIWAGRERLWACIFSPLSTAIFVTMYEWVLRIRRTQVSAEPSALSGERTLRAAQALAVAYGLLWIAFPRKHDALLRGQMATLDYWLFALPLFSSLLLAFAAVASIVRSRFDRAEAFRLEALGLAAPFLMSGLLLPNWQALGTTVGEMIFLGGAIRYHVMQGQRAQFLSRFLSPQVTRLVNERGLRAIEQARAQVSVVACDLRGFTAFSETAEPEEVTQLLREYYDSLGRVVSEFGGTIQNLVGDGILALVGAPISVSDHARRAVEMALKMQERGGEVLSKWTRMGLQIGLGIGVASGYVTVGMIDSAARLEFIVVGSAVNLASRLCDHARDGQVLLDQRSVALVSEDEGQANRFLKVDSAEFKGFGRELAVFAISR